MDRNERTEWQHSHDYTLDFSVAERRTRIVIGITAVMMVIEIGAGIAFKSMALLADGWHMSTHVAAFLITAIAYYFSRRHKDDPRYSFGTGKMGVLGGFASAIILCIVALLMAGESCHRLFHPVSIDFNDAIGVAIAGLVVNVVCALILKDSHAHHHSHGQGHSDHHHGHHHDLNMKAAYTHVIADALTSMTAIVALLSGKLFGWTLLDPIMGIVGSAVITVWAYGLLRDTSGILLDRTPESSDLPQEIRRAVESNGDAVITDLHLWQVSGGKYAAIVCIAGSAPKAAEEYRQLFKEHEELVHVTIEVQVCGGIPSPMRRE